MLGHVNKYNGDDGKPIFAGTTDMRDDCDCSYTVHVVEEDKFNGPKTIKFENTKNRGDVAHEVVYQYDCSMNLTYQERLDSIVEIGEADHDEVNEMFKLNRTYSKNEEVIKAVRKVISAHDLIKSELVKKVMDEFAFSRRRIIKALDEHTGTNEGKYQFWHLEIRDKNTKFYVLN